MSIRDQFFAVDVPETAIAGMGEIIEQARVFGLREWYDSLDPEFVEDLVSAWETWKSQQTSQQPEVFESVVTLNHCRSDRAANDLPTVPEETVPPPVLECPVPTNGRRFKVKFKMPKIPHIH